MAVVVGLKREQQLSKSTTKVHLVEMSKFSILLQLTSNIFMPCFLLLGRSCAACKSSWKSTMQYGWLPSITGSSSRAAHALYVSVLISLLRRYQGWKTATDTAVPKT